MAIALVSLGFAVAFDNGLSLFWFFLTAVAITMFRGIHLLATAVGIILTDMIIEYQPPTAGFVLSA